MEWTARIVLVSCFSVPVRFSFSYIGYYRNVLDWVWKIGLAIGSGVLVRYLSSSMLYSVSQLLFVAD